MKYNVKSENIHMRVTKTDRRSFVRLAKAVGSSVTDYLCKAGKKQQIQVLGVKNGELVRYLTSSLSGIVMELTSLRNIMSDIYWVCKGADNVDVTALLDQLAKMENYIMPAVDNANTLIETLQSGDIYSTLFKVDVVDIDLESCRTELQTEMELKKLEAVVNTNNNALNEFMDQLQKEQEQALSAGNEEPGDTVDDTVEDDLNKDPFANFDWDEARKALGF